MNVAIRFVPTLIQAKLGRTGICGAYVLGKLVESTFVPTYVGRSDSCLRTRLSKHELLGDPRATHVVWRETGSPRAAYNYECTLYHTHAEDHSLINEIHPAAPKESGLICPVCSYADGEVAERERA